MAAEQPPARCIVFLTQDATPASDTLAGRAPDAAWTEARVGLSFGPHLPRPGTSPMVARELEEFFGSFTDAAAGPAGRDGRAWRTRRAASSRTSTPRAARVLGGGALPRRRLRGGPGVRARRDGGRVAEGIRAGAGVLHAHDYPFAEFMRRYFDEYRGLRDTVGPRGADRAGARRARRVAEVRGDLRYMREQGWSRAAQAGGWAAALGPPPRGPRARRALGSRARPPARGARRRLSLEGRGECESGPPGTARAAAAGAIRRRQLRAALLPRAPAPLAAVTARRQQAAAAPRLGDPAVPARQRRAHDDLHDRPGAGARGSLQLDLDPRPRRQDGPACRGRPPRAERALRAAAGRRVHRLRRLARRRRRDGDRMADRLSRSGRSPAAS